MAWSNEKTLKFINAIHMRPALWDVNSNEFQMRSLKKNGWTDIGHEFDVSSEVAQKKYRNLRTHLKMEFRKLQQKEKRSSGACVTSNWFAFNAMQFLLKRDTADSGGDSTPTYYNQNCIAESYLTIVYSDNDVDDTMNAESQPLSRRPQSKRKSREVEQIQEAYESASMTSPVTNKSTNIFQKRRRINEERKRRFTIAKNSEILNARVDESEAFGLYVSSKLTKVLHPEQRMFAEVLITKTLNKAIMNSLSEFTDIVDNWPN